MVLRELETSALVIDVLDDIIASESHKGP